MTSLTLSESISLSDSSSFMLYESALCLLSGQLLDGEGRPLSYGSISLGLDQRAQGNIRLVLSGALLSTAPVLVTADVSGYFSCHLWQTAQLTPQVGYWICPPFASYFYATIPTQTSITLSGLLALPTTILFPPPF